MLAIGESGRAVCTATDDRWSSDASVRGWSTGTLAPGVQASVFAVRPQTLGTSTERRH
jgi:hypothetical protein